MNIDEYHFIASVEVHIIIFNSSLAKIPEKE
jgi:hypothetical protein